MLTLAQQCALDRSDHIEKWSEQERTVLTLYAAFAAQAPWYLDPEHRRAMYERLGLRVTAYKEGPARDRLLIQNCLPISTCKNTPRGGRSIAIMIRSRSIISLLLLLTLHLIR
jgi:hypothetical protein